jgi:acyl carrier protein
MPMGLDSVELVLEVEDAFGLSIPDEDADSLTTVGMLYDYVLAHRFHGTQDACLTSMTFYKLRRGLMLVLQLPRNAVRTSTELSAIIPKRRRRIWRALEKATGFRLPFLRRPRWGAALATLTTIGLGIATPALLGLKPFGGGVIVAMVSILLLAFVFSWLTEILAYDFPPDVATAGQLAKATLARNYQPILAESKKSATDAEVWDMLRRIIGEQLGFRVDQLTKETSFVKDLYVD